MQLKPLKELLKLTKEGLDEALAPVRARQIKASADVAVAKLEEKLLNLEREVTEACSKKDISFDLVLDKLDQYALTERRIKQFEDLVTQLFPATPKK
jgi:Zn-dependent M32 family carboxypeptidase